MFQATFPNVNTETAYGVIDKVRMKAPIFARDPGEKEFHQAVQEMVETVMPVLERHPEYRRLGVLERITEPERVITFRVPWMDDVGWVRVNRGNRVEMNCAIGPFKGGLRIHPSVNLSIPKFLAFEQVFKDVLTTLPMGGAQGGADFETSPSKRRKKSSSWAASQKQSALRAPSTTVAAICRQLRISVLSGLQLYVCRRPTY